ELVPDKPEYASGDDIRLMINTERAGSTVYLFVRGTGNVGPRPKIIRLEGKSALETIHVEPGDRPNFFIDAFTVSDGAIHKAVRQIVVPPEKQVLTLEVTPDAQRYKP